MVWENCKNILTGKSNNSFFLSSIETDRSMTGVNSIFIFFSSYLDGK